MQLVGQTSTFYLNLLKLLAVTGFITHFETSPHVIELNKNCLRLSAGREARISAENEEARDERL